MIETTESQAATNSDPDGFIRSRTAGPIHVVAVTAPWGPIHVATTSEALVGLAVHAPRDAFVADIERRMRRLVQTGEGDRLGERAVVALEAFLAGDGRQLTELPLDLGDAGPWDRAVLGGVRALAWGEVTSYGGAARMIGRPGAARAVGGAVGRNPIGLAIPCHRVIAGDGTLGGYGGDWFGSRDEHLRIKRELLDREGVSLPARLPRL
jgi:methylated-DNA-[protein]-cysteine S-methyltransferase